MARLILGFVGPQASGKGTACKYLVEHHAAATYRFSTILRDVADRLHIPQSREDLQRLSTALRQTFGEDLLSKAMAADVEAESKPIVAIDGIRRITDIEFLLQLPHFQLVAIDAEERIRFERVTKRGENTDDRSKTWEQFQKDGEQESERQIRSVMAQAKHRIDNNGDFTALYAQLDSQIDSAHAG